MESDVPSPLLRLSQRTGRSIADLMEVYEERAGIMEHDGNPRSVPLSKATRDAADLAAVSDVLAMYEKEHP